jgi:predicted nucleotidyltransferase
MTPVRRYDSLISRREQIFEIATRYGARNVRVFGSVARGEDGPESDVDLLVEFEPGRETTNSTAGYRGGRWSFEG